MRLSVRETVEFCRIAKPLRRSEHMRMRVTGVGRRRHFRPAYITRRQTGGNHLSHSAFMPAASMIGPHFLASARILASNSEGELPIGDAPSLPRRSFTESV